MKGSNSHPNEGDDLVLTGIVYNRSIIGLDLPNGYKTANQDQTFDEYPVKVIDIEQDRLIADDRLVKEIITLEKPDGTTTKVTYNGREKIAGSPGMSFDTQNSQGACQAYTWEKV